jgi:MHS family proline/betaine transporter-like MFS transporter
MKKTVTYVRELMISDVKTVDESSTVQKVAKLMAKQNIGAVVVVGKQGNPSGIFTERDLMKKVIANDLSLETPVSKVMTTQLVCVQMQDKIEGLPELMIKGNFRHLPVVDDFKLMGILSVKDLLAYFINKNH